MRRPLALALALALLPLALVAASCATSSTEQRAANEVASSTAHVQLEFAWPVPAGAWVTEFVEKDGTTSLTRYRVEVEPKRGALHVFHREMSLLEIDGEPITSTSDGDRAAVEAFVKQSMASMPTLVASMEGDYQGVTGLDELIDLMLELDDEKEEEQRKAVAAIMHSPEVKAMLTNSLGEIWMSWAGLWKGMTLREGEPVEKADPNGVGTYRLVALSDDTVTVEYRYVFDRERFAAGVRASVVNMARRAGKDPAEAERQLADMQAEKTSTFLAELDRRTLLPRSVSREEDTRIETPSEGPQTRREVHRYQFEWDAPGTAVSQDG